MKRVARWHGAEGRKKRNKAMQVMTRATLAAAAVLCGAFVNALQSRTIYLSLALFHGYLELALFAYFWALGLRASRSTR